jgi:glycosyltransferase involved in cell wall biosynthesis
MSIALRENTAKFAIVTAYFKEEKYLLERCLRSVRQQSVAADHIVIADGAPQAWLDEAHVRHITLDRSHGDYGNTARGVGALLAVAEDYDAIGFLDADNWLELDHIAQCLAAAATVSGEPCDYVIAQRNHKRPDETTIAVDDEPIIEHVDTNCFFFLPGAYHMIQRFAMIPKQLSIIGDRLFYKQLQAQQLRAAIVPVKTVNYQCMWESIYRSVSETPPDGAKPGVDQRPIAEWLNALSPNQKRVVSRRTNLRLV